MIEVTFFAAAREAAGTHSAHVSVTSVSDLRARLIQDFGDRMVTVLDVSSLVSDGRRLQAGDPLADGAHVHVLPPFAGG